MCNCLSQHSAERGGLYRLGIGSLALMVLIPLLIAPMRPCEVEGAVPSSDATQASTAMEAGSAFVASWTTAPTASARLSCDTVAERPVVFPATMRTGAQAAPSTDAVGPSLFLGVAPPLVRTTAGKRRGPLVLNRKAAPHPSQGSSLHLRSVVLRV